jgi:hypothetical protein
MDGTLAALFLIAGLTDMGLNHCGADGCLAKSDATARLAFSAGDVQFQENSISEEVYLRYALGNNYGPFQPTVGASITSDGSAWFGFGASWTQQFANNRAYVQLSLMPGIYSQGSGPDLGHEVEFRSGIELGFEARNGVRYGLSYDHRSNAEISSLNPGLETIQFRVSVPLK